MKKLAILSLVVCFGISLASSALALRWPDNASRRVGAMGNATLSIEDETTALTIFNHENIAGIAFNTKENRADFGLGYTSTLKETEYPIYGTREETTSGMEFTRPGAEYRGVTYWLDDNIIIRAGVEALLMNGKTTFTPLSGDVTEEGISFSGIGGGASFTYKAGENLAFGAGLSYLGAGGKPDDLEGAYAVYGAGNTDKVEMSASNLSWGIGAGYLLQMNEKNKLNFGLQIHSDDDMPDVASIAQSVAYGGTPSATSMGDYNLTLLSEGVNGTYSDQYDFTQSPLFISAEVIYNFSSILEAGVLIDYGMKSINMKYEGVTPATTTNIDYKTADINELILTEVVRANIPVGDSLAILPGIFYTNAGSSTVDNFSLSSPTETYKSSEDVNTNGTFGMGCGLQALNKQLQVALEYDFGAWINETTTFDINGNELNTGDADGVHGTFKVGAEFWVIPMLALRAGYQSGSMIIFGTTQDFTSTTNTISFGAGLAMPEGLTLDLLVQLVTNTTDPAADPEPTDTGMNAYLGVKIPL